MNVQTLIDELSQVTDKSAEVIMILDGSPEGEIYDGGVELVTELRRASTGKVMRVELRGVA